jgi:hypothetical protein
MRKIGLIISWVLISTGSYAQHNLFSSVWDSVSLDKALTQKWQPFPVYSDRAEWDSLPTDARTRIVSDGEKLLGKSYDFLPLTEYLGFVRDGNRSRYEAIYFGRRAQLLQLVMAECVEGRGRFKDDILNGIWTLCEETSWCIPAHIGQADGMPDQHRPVIDLFAAETSALLAFTDYLYGSELSRTSPRIQQRLREEIHNRVLTPFIERNDIFWMGFGSQPVNNWNPWILSNILASSFLIEENRGLCVQQVAKSIRCLDNFTNCYPADGGCDEGPSYWGRAGGSLYDCLETLFSASNGKINFYQAPLVKNIGEYIGKAFIRAPWYINFADAPARIQPDAYVVFNFGRRIHDDQMMAFGAQLDSGRAFSVSPRLESFGRCLPYLFALKDIRSSPHAWPYLRDSWLPDLQVVAARSFDGVPDGLFFAAKGGHNAESHNHNDVGSFVVYYNGQPVLIDAGVGAYTAKTFSKDRYSIWSMQSQYHNLPTVNGIMQSPGRNFAAQNLYYASDGKQVRFSLDLTACYPAEAMLEKWNRSYQFVRAKELRVTDTYRLTEIKGTTSWNFLTCLVPEMTQSGMITLQTNGEYKADKKLRISYAGKELQARIEEIHLAPGDGYIWKSTLYRIVFTPVSMKKSGKAEFKIQAED